jgi:hypothetical protein
MEKVSNTDKSNEFFDRIYDLIDVADLQQMTHVRAVVRDLLVAVCQEDLKSVNQNFGSLFFQVDFVCRRHRISGADKYAIQSVRRHTHTYEYTREALFSDLRSLSNFISSVFGVAVPYNLQQILPAKVAPIPVLGKVDMQCVRCIVNGWNDEVMKVTADLDSRQSDFSVSYTASENDFSYLQPLLKVGMQLNLLDCTINGKMVIPRFIVVEPDFMIDISSIAHSYSEYGHHPYSFIMNKMGRRPNSQPILLGNFASSALDDILHTDNTDDYKVTSTIRHNCREKLIEFCTCPDFNTDSFVDSARTQASNLCMTVHELFDQGNFDRNKALLEPSFVCESLGILGRVDLMTSDFKLLVEQKSGKNGNIENPQYRQGHMAKEEHLVQLLLYYGVMHYNFQVHSRDIDIKLLYSKYAPSDGIVNVAYLNDLFADTVRFRNRLVTTEIAIAENGFDKIVDQITPECLNERHCDNRFFIQWLLPQILEKTEPLRNMSPLMRAYFCRMCTFSFKELQLSKIGSQEGAKGCNSDLWNMPLDRKRESGNIFVNLTIVKKEKSSDFNGFDLITLDVPDQGMDFLPNFRPGDMVYLYSYAKGEIPDVRHSILYSANLLELSSSRLLVQLGDGQQNPDVFGAESTLFAMEHASTDASFDSALRGLHELLTAPESRRQLLLGQRLPLRDDARCLSRSYDPDCDSLLLKAKQANDFFLLVGPPGTGKTHRALRFLLQEELQSSESASVLLLAYTNRAVDEICSMLCEAGLNFLRLGRDCSCNPLYRKYLLNNQFVHADFKVPAVKAQLKSVRVVVGTVSYLSSKPYVLSLKTFSLAIVDEASQILEPDIVGLLASHQHSTEVCDISKFILVGDYKQLPAVVLQSKTDSAITDPELQKAGFSNCAVSLFYRLISSEYRRGCSDFVGILRKQGRMHPEIAEFPNRMFYLQEHLQPVPLAHQLDADLHYQPEGRDALDLALKQHRLLFIPSDFCLNPDLSDKVNTKEAEMVAVVLDRIFRFCADDFDSEQTVGVIVPYRNQIAMIRKCVEQLHIPQLSQITIDTVERFQGSQRDIIIYSFTVQQLYQLDFLTLNNFIDPSDDAGRIIDPKLNVAITRARKQLILLGNPKVLSSNFIFKQLMDYIKEHNGYFVPDK